MDKIKLVLYLSLDPSMMKRIGPGYLLEILGDVEEHTDFEKWVQV